MIVWVLLLLFWCIVVSAQFWSSTSTRRNVDPPKTGPGNSAATTKSMVLDYDSFEFDEWV